MIDDEFDRTFSSEDEILPSSGFVASVMEAVRIDALTPPPIPFPWRRALPGLGVAALALAWLLVAAVMQFGSETKTPFPAAALPSTFEPILEAAVWSVLALLLSLALLMLSIRWTSRHIRSGDCS